MSRESILAAEFNNPSLNSAMFSEHALPVDQADLRLCRDTAGHSLPEAAGPFLASGHERPWRANCAGLPQQQQPLVTGPGNQRALLRACRLGETGSEAPGEGKTTPGDKGDF